MVFVDGVLVGERDFDRDANGYVVPVFKKEGRHSMIKITEVVFTTAGIERRDYWL